MTKLGPTEPLDPKRHSAERFDCGRPALDRWLREAQGVGLGAGLLLDALERAVTAAELVGIRAVVVHALDDDAAAFYRHFSFAPVGSALRTLMVPLAAVRRIVRPSR